MEEILALDAEMSVLGSILKDPTLLKNAILSLSPEDFSTANNQQVFAAMIKLDAASKKIDSPTVIEQLVTVEKKNADNVKAYLTRVLNSVPKTGNMETWIDIIKKQAAKRKLKALAKDLLADTDEQSGVNAEEILTKLTKDIGTISTGADMTGPIPITKALTSVYDRLYNLSGPNRKDFIGIPTGYTDLDKMICGLNKTDLIIIAGRPAMGKTAFALNVGTNVAKRQHKNVLIFSLEMSAEQLTQRLAAAETDIPSTHFRNGSLTPDEWGVLNSAADYLARLPIYIDDTANITPMQMKAKIQKMGNIDLVIIDYLSLMKLGRKVEGRVQEVSEITRELKIMAKELKIPIICLCQLNRNVDSRDNTDHRPQLSDLRESGSIEQDADLIMMMFRKNYYKDADYEPVLVNGIEVQTANVLVRKNRHGPIGDVKLAYVPAFTRFDNLSPEAEKQMKGEDEDGN